MIFLFLSTCYNCNQINDGLIYRSCIGDEFNVMEIIYEGLHNFGYGTLSRAFIGLFGIDEGLMPYDHLITGCLPSYYC
jgi:hypothetical protein